MSSLAGKLVAVPRSYRLREPVQFDCLSLGSLLLDDVSPEPDRALVAEAKDSDALAKHHVVRVVRNALAGG